MLCDRCKKNEASVHIRKVQKNGEVEAMNLCPPCAMLEFLDNAKMLKGLGVSPEDLHLPLDLEKDMLGKLFNGELEKLFESQRALANMKCSSCNARGEALSDSSILNCPDCVQNMRSFLREVMPKVVLEDKNTNFAVVPELNREVQLRETLHDLERQMDSAVVGERYEEASDLQKRISLTKVQLKEAERVAERRAAAGSEKVTSPEKPKKSAFDVHRPTWCGPKKRSKKPEIILSSCMTMMRNVRGMKFAPESNDKAEMARCRDYLVFTLLSDELLAKCKRVDWEKLAISGSERNQYNQLSWSCQGDENYNHPASLLVNPSAGIKIRVNFLDHISCTLWGAPDDLPKLYRQMLDLDERLSKKIPFQRDPEYGLVTRYYQCMGTGMSPCKIMHLPALMLFSKIDAVKAAMAAMGLRLVPMFQRDPGPEKFSDMVGCGALYFLDFNLPSVESMSARIATLESAAGLLERFELQRREEIRGSHELRLRCSDLVGKAVGVARYSSMLTDSNVREILSTLWFGAEMDILPEIKPMLWRGDLKRAFGQLECTEPNPSDAKFSPMRIQHAMVVNALALKMAVGFQENQQ